MKMKRNLTGAIVDAFVFTVPFVRKVAVKELENIGCSLVGQEYGEILVQAPSGKVVRMFPGNVIAKLEDGSLKAYPNVGIRTVSPLKRP